MQQEPYTPLANIPWLKWVDRTQIPAFVIGFFALLLFVPFYNFNALTPRLPLEGAAFPPAFALALMFFLQLTRGAAGDLRQLIFAGKIDTSFLESLAASKSWARGELLLGLGIGAERVYAQLRFSAEDGDMLSMMSPGALVVCFSILAYTVVQIHLLAFCVRQVAVFRRVAKTFEIDLMAPELNNALSNPLIRFIVVGLIGISSGLLVYEMIPYQSLQMRVLESGALAIVIWLLLIFVSFVPLLILKSRIAVAKAMEISRIRQALQGNMAGIEHSQFGERLADFSPADLMYYEDRIKNIWEWPFQAHVRRLVIFVLLPPLTWILAAGVEIVFENILMG